MKEWRFSFTEMITYGDSTLPLYLVKYFYSHRLEIALVTSYWSYWKLQQRCTCFHCWIQWLCIILYWHLHHYISLIFNGEIVAGKWRKCEIQSQSHIKMKWNNFRFEGFVGYDHFLFAVCKQIRWRHFLCVIGYFDSFNLISLRSFVPFSICN